MANLEERERATPPRQYGTTAARSSSVADILERVLDKGIVITGDIKINLTNVELLTIQIRLIICSVDRAVEIGLDWWKTNPNFSSQAREALSAGAARAPAGEAPEKTETLQPVLTPKPV